MIYLDNAATSYPKPAIVAAQAAELLQQALGNPFRSGHQAARQSAALIWRVKTKIANLINAESPDHIALCYNCSDAMNMLLQALVQQLRPPVFTDLSAGTQQCFTAIGLAGGAAADPASAMSTSRLGLAN